MNSAQDADWSVDLKDLPEISKKQHNILGYLLFKENCIKKL